MARRVVEWKSLNKWSNNIIMSTRSLRGTIRPTLLTTAAAAMCAAASSSSSTSFHRNPCCFSFMQTFTPPSSLYTRELSFSKNRRHIPNKIKKRIPTHLQQSSSSSPSPSPFSPPSFRRGDKIQVEISFFGRLGASVNVIGRGHAEENVIGEDDPPLGQGLILQSEIGYFRSKRNNVDVVVGEILPAYVEQVREEDDKLNISLRPPGGGAKSSDLAQEILDHLKWTKEGVIDVGDKSTPEEINREFPGASKGSFKKAVAKLYKRGKVKPGPHSITLM